MVPEEKKEKVIGLFGPVLDDGTREPQDAVVKALEDILERARSGEIVGVGIIEMYRDGGTACEAVGKVNKRSFLGCLVQMLVYESSKN